MRGEVDTMSLVGVQGLRCNFSNCNTFILDQNISDFNLIFFIFVNLSRKRNFSVFWF